jgi:hypothetical protein
LLAYISVLETLFETYIEGDYYYTEAVVILNSGSGHSVTLERSL